MLDAFRSLLDSPRCLDQAQISCLCSFERDDLTIDVVLLCPPRNSHIPGALTSLPMERAPVFVEKLEIAHGDSHGQKFWLFPFISCIVAHFTLPLVSLAHSILRKAAERPRAIQS